MNVNNQYKSNIETNGEREVYQINTYETLIEKYGLYLIKNTEDGIVSYRGIDSSYDDDQVLNIVKNGG